MKFQIILVFISLISEADEHFEVVLTFICSIENSLFKCLAQFLKLDHLFSRLCFLSSFYIIKNPLSDG